MTFETILSGFSVIAALLSALWASRSNRIAKQALDLARSENQARQGSVQAYLAQIHLTRELEAQYIVASVTYTNQSHLDDSIARLELVVHYVANDVRTNLVIPASTSKKRLNRLGDIVISAPPLHIAPRGAVASWLCFQLPELISEDRRIESYELEATFASGRKSVIETAFVSELLHVE